MRRWKDPKNGIAALMRSRNPICQYLDDRAVQCRRASAVVHHLVDPKDTPTLFFDWSNLVAVCAEHHQGGQRGETQGYKYCHTIGMMGIIYYHGYLFPAWHEKYVASTGDVMLSYSSTSVGAGAIAKALAEEI